MSVLVHFHETSWYNISEDSVLHVDTVCKETFQQFSVASWKMVTGMYVGDPVLPVFLGDISTVFCSFLENDNWYVCGRPCAQMWA